MSVLRTIQSSQVLDALADVKVLADRVTVAAARAEQYWALAGVEKPSPSWRAHRLLQRARAALNRADREVIELHNHAHIWNEDDTCSICGADGLA